VAGGERSDLQDKVEAHRTIKRLQIAEIRDRETISQEG
jgi:hypothetical protein